MNTQTLIEQEYTLAEQNLKIAISAGKVLNTNPEASCKDNLKRQIKYALNKCSYHFLEARKLKKQLNLSANAN